MSTSYHWLKNVQEQVKADGYTTPELLEAIDIDPAKAQQYVEQLDDCREQVRRLGRNLDPAYRIKRIQAYSHLHLTVLGQTEFHQVYACLVMCGDWQPIHHEDWSSIEHQVAKQIVWIAKQMGWDPGWELSNPEQLCARYWSRERTITNTPNWI